MSREPRPLMVVIAGHNGAGKSTCYRSFLAATLGQHLDEHIDPDAVEREIRAEMTEAGIVMPKVWFSAQAQKESNKLREQYFASRTPFSFETVLSDPVGDKVEFMRRAVEGGYLVVLMAVGLDSPEKSLQRVSLRVQHGGHDVPVDRVYSRYPRVIENLRKASLVATLAILIDNSDDNTDYNAGAYRPFALFAGGALLKSDGATPEWWGSLH
ncbi:MAG: zeta toxin family protein [Planctomycetota bacterium]